MDSSAVRSAFASRSNALLVVLSARSLSREMPALSGIPGMKNPSVSVISASLQAGRSRVKMAMIRAVRNAGNDLITAEVLADFPGFWRGGTVVPPDFWEGLRLDRARVLSLSLLPQLEMELELKMEGIPIAPNVQCIW